jgi:RimJ/RimL family protein N-acetyltransferase
MPPEKLSYQPLQLPADTDRLLAFLSAHHWPFHGNETLSQEKVQAMLAEGLFSGSNHECFWLAEGSTEVGFLRIFDLDDVDDGYPLFDLRIHPAWRGQGFGTEAVRWLNAYLFRKFPGLDRIAGTTRADNLAMRRVFLACGYAKEGHYREDWNGPNGQSFDTVKYGILRRDWETGTVTPVAWDDEPKQRTATTTSKVNLLNRR